ncbi:MAG TPA: LamG-like jellyroll fold domain-containing protein, partial [Candidatus Limnocylindrales bacterium]
MSNRRRTASRSVVAAAVAALAMSLAPIASPASVQAAPSGPVAEWKFNESSGTTAADFIGSNDGSLIGNPTWSPGGGHEGGALVFDGSGDGVQIPTAAALEPSSLSVTLWMKGTRTANGEWDSLLQKGANACEAGSYGLQAYARTPGVSPGEAGARTETSAVGNYAASYSPEAALWDGAWHFLAFTTDGVGEAAKLYIDGIAADGQFTPLLYGLPTASDLFIGHEPVDCPDARDFQGSLDDVRIYDRALSASEIQSQVAAITTTATLEIETNPVEYGQWTWANVTLTPGPVEATPVRIYDVTNGGHVLIATSGISPLDGVGRVQINSNPPLLSIGSHDLAAEVDAIGPYAAASTGSTAFGVQKITNTVTITAPTSALPGASVQLTGSLSRGTNGTVTFFEDHGGGVLDEIGTTTPSWNGVAYVASLMTGSLSIGDHSFFVRVNETDVYAGVDSDPAVVHVAIVPSQTSLGADGTLQAHHALTLYTAVGPLDPIASPPPPTGSVTIKDGATVVGSVDLATSNQLVISSPTVGAHTYTAEYPGDAFYQASTSTALPVTIAPDTVDAASVTVAYAVFYPYKDGYRDTDAIKGNRIEPLSVSIRVYNANNGLVKSVSLARAAGAYAYAWNGRTSSGTMLAAGKYRIVQTLTDAFGTKKAFTSYATISSKRLVSHSTYVTRYGYPPTATGQGGTGRGYYSSTGKYLKLVAGSDG